MLVLGYGCPAWTEPDFSDLTFGRFPLEWCYDNFLQLATASIVVSFFLRYHYYPSTVATTTTLVLWLPLLP